jgi:hypothetical protein
MRGKPTFAQIRTAIDEAERKVGDRVVDKASFEYGYWEGIMDERRRVLTEYMDDAARAPRRWDEDKQGG